METWHRITKELFTIISIWVCFTDLKLEYWNNEGISRIASNLGNTAMENSLNYARVLIKVDVEFSCLNTIQLQLYMTQQTKL